MDGIIELNYINKNQKIKYNIKNEKIVLNSIDKKFTGEINIKPFFVLVKSIKFGGIPTEKRSTPTPTLLAAQKCRDP